MIDRATLTIPSSYEAYVNNVKEADPVKGLYRNTKSFRKLLNDIPRSKANYAYAPGKWTLKEMLQHIIDAERVFAFRALHFARKDASPLPGFDENQWADNSKAATRKWKDLINEFFELRSANERLFTSMNDEQLMGGGVANNNQVSVAALAFVIAGHLEHHITVIRERYLKSYPAGGKKNGKEADGEKKKNGKKTSKKKKDDKKGEGKKLQEKKAAKGKPVEKKAAAGKSGKNKPSEKNVAKAAVSAGKSKAVSTPAKKKSKK